MTASINIKGNKYYVILRWSDDSGTWHTQWIGTDLTVDGNNKRKAEQKRVEVLREWQTKEELTGVNILFSDFMMDWLEMIRCSVSKNTYYGYKNTVERVICPWFHERKIKLRELKPFHIQDFYHQRMEDGVSANTIWHYHANIRKALTFAVKSKRITENPALEVVLPQKQKHIPNVYSEDELRKMIAAVIGTTLEPVVFLAAWFGLRRGEIIGLRWDAIDFDKRILSITGTVKDKGESGSRYQNAFYEPTAKTQSSFRSFPLSQTQIDYLKHRKALQNQCRAVKPWYDHKWDGFVCVKPDGNLIYPDYVTRAFPKLCEKVGLKRLKLHELRHTNISLLLDDGASMKELQEWAGHSSYTTTANIYAHLTAKSKDKLSASIDRILG